MNKVNKKDTFVLLAVLCLGLTFMNANRTALYPLLSIFGDEYNLTSTQLGAITSSYFIVYVAMQIPSGFIGDKVGRKRLLIGMYLLSGLGLLGFGLLAKSYYALIFFIALHGFGAGSYYPSAFGMVLASVDTSWRSTAVALVSLGFSIGLILGLAASGPIYIFTGNISAIFIILSVLTLLIVPIFYKVLPDVEQGQRSSAKFDVRALLKNRDLLLINIAHFCTLFGHWVAVTWGPTFFLMERNISMGLSGMLVAVVGLSAIIPSLVIGRLSDKLGRKKLALGLFPLAALFISLLAYAHSNLAIVLYLMAYGMVGKGSWDPIAVAWMGEHATSISKDALGTATGILNFAGMMSAVVAPILSGFILDLTSSLVSAFYLAAFLSLVGGVMVLFVREKPQIVKDVAKDS